MRLFQAALDTPLDSPLLRSPMLEMGVFENFAKLSKFSKISRILRQFWGGGAEIFENRKFRERGWGANVPKVHDISRNVEVSGLLGGAKGCQKFRQSKCSEISRMSRILENFANIAEGGLSFEIFEFGGGCEIFENRSKKLGRWESKSSKILAGSWNLSKFRNFLKSQNVLFLKHLQ